MGNPVGRGHTPVQRRCAFWPHPDCPPQARVPEVSIYIQTRHSFSLGVESEGFDRNIRPAELTNTTTTTTTTTANTV